ncbi:hypothetical protein [Hypericibacter sp.]|uniref:hypothetical protein n=1 Tax=Hypericibacter sp. TaxID=2705401 RepID=UPI003D6C8482
MATRFYLPSTGDAAVNPAFDAGWGSLDPVNPPTRKRMVIARANTNMNTQTKGQNATVALPGTVDCLHRQYVSDPLQAQAIAGTVKGQVRCQQGAATNDFRAQMLVKVVSSDGLTLRGILLAFDASGLTSEFSTSLRNRAFPLAWTTPGDALSNVNALAGDRLAIELGVRAHLADGTMRTFALRLGDNQLTDLPEDETSSSDFNPWIEFSQTLLFQAPGAGTVAPEAMMSHRRRRS